MNDEENTEADLITFNVGISILKDLFSLCDQSDKLANQLELEGFSAFRVHQNYELSYCRSDEERRVHKKYVTESAKEFLASAAIVLPSERNEVKRRFESPFLAELRRKRDQENGVPLDRLAERYPDEGERYIRRQIDPATRQIMVERARDYDLLEARENASLDSQWKQIELESRRYASGEMKNYDVNRTGRCKLLCDLLERLGKPLGFYIDRANSSKFVPIFTHTIVGPWELRIAPEDTRGWTCSQHVERANRGGQPHLRLRLHLCRSDVANQLGTKVVPGTAMSIDYNVFVQGITAYGFFFDHTKLALVATAQMQLISQVLDNIVRSIVTNF